MTNPFTQRAERIAQICTVTATVIFLLSSLLYLYLGHWPVTHLDFWRIYEICLDRSWLASALSKFNNHSLFFPSFIWLGDLRFFQGRQEAVFFVGMVLLIFTATLLLVPLVRDKTLSANARIAASTVLVVGNFWMGRASILGSGGFNCIASLSMVGTVLAFLYLPRIAADSPRPWTAALIVIAAGFLASFSYSTGLAVWPTLLLLGWCLRLPWRSLALVAVGTLGAVIIFMLLPGPSSVKPLHVDFSAWLGATTTTLQWLCRLIGTPLISTERSWHGVPKPSDPVVSPVFSLVGGAVGLLLAILVALPRVIRRDLRKDRLEFIGLALLSSTLLAMIMIVIGRAPLIRVLPNEVSAPRYFFWSTLFWAGLLLIGIQRAESKRWLRYPVLLGPVMLAIFVLPKHYQEGARCRYVASLAEAGATSLINGVRDAQKVKILFHDPDQVYRLAKQLKSYRLDMFADGLQDWIGKAETDLFDGKHEASGLKANCRVDAYVKCDDGGPAARVVGWARKRGNEAPRVLVIVDATGMVCGVARTFSNSSFINLTLYSNKFSRASLIGYIRHYDATSQYSMRGADDGMLSDERILIPAPVANIPTF